MPILPFQPDVLKHSVTRITVGHRIQIDPEPCIILNARLIGTDGTVAVIVYTDNDANYIADNPATAESEEDLIALVVNTGTSKLIGEAGSKLYNTIKDKERALKTLDLMLGHTGAGQLSASQVSLTSSMRAPQLEALEQERQEAETAKQNLERLIQENLDDLPDLYRTSGGQ